MRRVFFLLSLAACGGEPFTETAYTPSGESIDAASVSVDPPSSAVFLSPPSTFDSGGDAMAVDAEQPDSGSSGEASADSSVVDASTHDTGDGAMVEGGPPCVYTHDNGLGGTWCDDQPLRTYTSAEALRACAAYTGDAAKCAARD